MKDLDERLQMLLALLGIGLLFVAEHVRDKARIVLLRGVGVVLILLAGMVPFFGTAVSVLPVDWVRAGQYTTPSEITFQVPITIFCVVCFVLLVGHGIWAMVYATDLSIDRRSKETEEKI